MMKCYLVGFNRFHVNSDVALAKSEVIYGNSPIDAVRRKFPDKTIKKVNYFSSEARHSDLIITECEIKDGRVVLQYNARHNCYIIR